MPDIARSITSGEKSVATATAASTEARQVMSMISGTVTVAENALFICIDNADYTQATKIFRFGVNGLQYSSSGKNGNWTTIIDANGNMA